MLLPDLVPGAMEHEEFRTLVWPLGVPTALIADDPRLLVAAAAACPDSPAAVATAGSGIEIRLETATTPSSSMSCAIEVQGSRLRVTGADFEGSADAIARRGACAVPTRLFDHPELLAAELLDPILLFLLTRCDRTPVHAAGIVVDRTAILLSGPSGTGKSSLAYAAAQCGVPILSDDTVYVQLEPGFRVWGLPRAIHLLPQDAPPGLHPIRIRGGRSKAAVTVGDNSAQACADRAVLVLLEPGSRPSLTPVAVDDARAALARLEPGFDLLPDQSASAAEALIKDGAWRLTLGSQPDEAVALLLAELPL